MIVSAFDDEAEDELARASLMLVRLLVCLGGEASERAHKWGALVITHGSRRRLDWG